MASAIMTVWLMPSRTVPSALGISTLNRICAGEAPSASAASTTGGGTLRSARLVSRIVGGTAKTKVTSTPGTLPMPTTRTIGTR